MSEAEKWTPPDGLEPEPKRSEPRELLEEQPLEGTQSNRALGRRGWLTVTLAVLTVLALLLGGLFYSTATAPRPGPPPTQTGNPQHPGPRPQLPHSDNPGPRPQLPDRGIPGPKPIFPDSDVANP